MNRQWEMEFDKVLKGALCQYRDRMLAAAEMQEEESFPVSSEFYRKINALGSASMLMERRRKRYRRRKAVQRGFAKVMAAAALISFLGVKGEVFRLPLPVAADAALGDFVIEWYPDHLRIRCRPLSEEEFVQTEVRESEEFELGYIPEGFILEEEKHHTGLSYYVYRNGEGDFVFFWAAWRNGNSPGRVMSSSMRIGNEQEGFRMFVENGTELIYAEARPGANGQELMWTQNGCEFNLLLVSEQKIDILELYRSIRLKEEKFEKK